MAQTTRDKTERANIFYREKNNTFRELNQFWMDLEPLHDLGMEYCYRPTCISREKGLKIMCLLFLFNRFLASYS